MNSPNIKELDMLFNLGPKEIGKSDSLSSSFQKLLKEMNAQDFEIIMKYPSDYISFKLFNDQLLTFKAFFPKDTLVFKEYLDFMVSTFSEEIQSTPEFKETYNELSNLDLKKMKPQQIDMNSIREDYLGKSFKFSDLKSKYILIDFWATWCGPCMRQVPYVKKLHEDYSSTDLEIIGVSADYNFNNLRKGIAENDMNWLHIYDESRVIAEEFQVTAYPTLFLVDKEGKVLWSGEGFSENKLEKVREILNKK